MIAGIDGDRYAAIKPKIDASLRYCLFDTDTTGLLKRRVPIAGGIGFGNLAMARVALGQQFRFDSAGIATAMKGIAIVLNQADADRYGRWLHGVELFIDDLPDLDLGLPPSNGQPTVEEPPAPKKTRAQGIRLPVELWDKLEAYAAEHHQSVSALFEEILQDFVRHL